MDDFYLLFIIYLFYRFKHVIFLLHVTTFIGCAMLITKKNSI
jgi:hypothetical protein